MDEKVNCLTVHPQQRILAKKVLNLYTSLLVNMWKSHNQSWRKGLGSCDISLDYIQKRKDNLPVVSTIVMTAKESIIVDVCLVLYCKVQEFVRNSFSVLDDAECYLDILICDKADSFTVYIFFYIFYFQLNIKWASATR